MTQISNFESQVIQFSSKGKMSDQMRGTKNAQNEQIFAKVTNLTFFEQKLMHLILIVYYLSDLMLFLTIDLIIWV